MKKKLNYIVKAAMIGTAALMLQGCSKAPESIENTDWKLTWLKAPDGTEYDEAAYDMLVGATYYHFLPQNSCVCNTDEEGSEIDYMYQYENGKLILKGYGVDCTGKVSEDSIEIKISEKGRARLTKLEEN